MDLTAEEFVDQLLSAEAHEKPSDSVKVDDLEMHLPEWFDEKKYNQGRRFYWDYSLMLTAAMLTGLVAVFSVPSILNILINSRRSCSTFTAYKRYFSTHLHKSLWFKYELKPGSKSWKSLYTVRSRHIQASRASALKGKGIVSQRDISLTLFGFIGFSFLKPDKFGITQLEKGDWDAYNHTWRVIAYMLGLEDRYNLCRETFEETREVLQLILDRVFTPCLENVPEYFEHMSRVMIDGLATVIDVSDTSALIYHVKHLADVPGYIESEDDRMKLQNKIRKILKGRSTDTGVDSSDLVQPCGIEGLPKRKPNLFYLHDYDIIEDSPFYRILPFKGKYNLAFNEFIINLYKTYYGRIILNWYGTFSEYYAFYCPSKPFRNFGLKNVFINIFKEDPVDNTLPKPNSEYIKPPPFETWYNKLLAIIW